MKLYYSPYACSLAPHIVLRELELPFEAVRVDLKTRRLADGRDYTKINPKGYVPALELDDGTLLTEGAAILQYLGGLRPGVLAPPETLRRYRTIEWLTFVSTELHKGFSPLLHSETPEAAKQFARNRLAQRLTLLDRHLSEHGFLAGGAYSVADAYAFAVLNWAKGVNIDLAEWPHVRAYFRRLAERPSVREALHDQREAEAA